LAKNLAIVHPNITLESKEMTGMMKMGEDEEMKEPSQLRNRILSEIIGEHEIDQQ